MVDNVGQQMQPFLPGMGNSSAIGRAVRAKKQPHQMTPEEFAAQPNAVFHTSHLYPERIRNMVSREEDYASGFATSPSIHVGSEQAAIENAARTYSGAYSSHNSDGSEEYPARLHVFHYIPKPGDNLKVHEDGISYRKPGSRAEDIVHDPYSYENDAYDDTYGIDTNHEYTHDVHDMPGLLYKNAAEDKGSVSISVNDPRRLKSLGDFVREAMWSGKGDEVHPKTMAMYKAGALDRGELVPDNFATEVKRKNDPYRKPDQMNLTPVLKPQDVELHRGQMFEPTQHGFPTEWRNRVPDTPTEKFSDRGPQLEAIKRMARKKRPTSSPAQ